MSQRNPLTKWWRKRQQRRRFQNDSREGIFEWIYQSNKWGGAESRSGKGSDTTQAGQVTAHLPELWQQLQVTTILDLPCGDMNWMSSLDLSRYDYTGADIVPTLIENNRQKFPQHTFLQLDICQDPLPAADFLLCRDLFVHLSFDDISLALNNIRKGSVKYLCCTTFTQVEQNRDKLTGNHRRLNMCLPPFNWPEPELLLTDGAIGETGRQGKSLGLWRVSEIQ
ncbi:MAG: class I SAM-dependent methyltransferase [Gammaproteobacteria bacterium]